MERLGELLTSVRQCDICRDSLPLGPRPVLVVDAQATVLIIGQAPGTRVHQSGIPWNDPSGDRLRQWLGIDRELFYSDPRIAIMPMGFCYPGKGKSGDLPPRKECAPQWHDRLLAHMPRVELVLLIGQYAQRYYLPEPQCSLTERVQLQRLDQRFLALPHPSPRNQFWLKRHPWFESDILPVLKDRFARCLETS